MKPETWVNEYPTKKGLYWFYGSLNTLSGLNKPRLHIIKVWQVRKTHALMYSIYGTGFTMFKAEGDIGKWQKILLPKLPSHDVNFPKGIMTIAGIKPTDPSSGLNFIAPWDKERKDKE